METQDEEQLTPPEKEPGNRRTVLIIGGAALSIIVCLVITVFFTQTYGLALYIGFPATAGFIAGFTSKKSASFLKMMGIITLITLGLGLLLLLLGMEGVICLIIIFVLLYLVLMIGYLLGRATRYLLPENNSMLVFIFLINPSCITADFNTEMIENTVSTELVINAPPTVVWQTLMSPISFDRMNSFFFKNGVNYPLGMQFTKRNDSIYLCCALRNGYTELYVNKLQPDSIIQFTSLTHVEPMKELTLYDSIHAAHANANNFRHNYGLFTVRTTGGGKTKLIATSSVSYRLAPAFYWNMWGTYLVRKMHTHVLESIKWKSEQATSHIPKR